MQNLKVDTNIRRLAIFPTKTKSYTSLSKYNKNNAYFSPLNSALTKVIKENSKRKKVSDPLI
jgi:hypothetical protein